MWQPLLESSSKTEKGENMKLKLFGTTATEPVSLMLLNGGYDAERGR